MMIQTTTKRAPAVLFSLVLAVLILIPVGPSLFLANAEASEEKDFLVLDAVEQKKASGDTELNRNLFPGLSSGIALLPHPDPSFGDYHYRLLKVAPNRIDEVKQRLTPLKHSPLYGMSKVRYFGRSQIQPIYLNQAFFTRTLSVTESRCNCIKTFPFEVFGSPPDTPIGYGCFFDYAGPEYLPDVWPAEAPSGASNSGTIKAPIHWGYVLCQSDVKEITVECSIELSRQGVPIGPANYSATPIAVWTADHLYLVRQVPGIFPQDIKDCGMETQKAIHGYPIGELENAADTDLLDQIKTETLHELIQAFSLPPINANLEVALSDEAILVRSVEKSALMAEKYESAGYLVRVYSKVGTIYVHIRYHVLAADSPSGTFNTLSKDEMALYAQSIEDVALTTRNKIRKTYSGVILEHTD